MNDLQIIELHKEVKYACKNEIKKLEKELVDNELDKDLVNEIKELRNIGFNNFDYSRVLNELESNKNYLDDLKKYEDMFSGFTLITQNTVESICEKHNLIANNISEYTAEVPFETIKKYNKFKKHVNKNGISDMCLKRLYVIAPKEKFDKEAKNRIDLDPILVSDVCYRGFYVVIHAWGFEKKLLKNI